MVQEQRDGLGDRGRMREGRRKRMREQGLAWVRAGQHLQTLRRCLAFWGRVQSETMMRQKCNWVHGLILWILLEIYYSSCLVSGTGDCWEQARRGAWWALDKRQLWVAASLSHRPLDTATSVGLFSLQYPWLTQKIFWLMSLLLWNHSLSGAFNGSPGRALKVKIG